MSDTVSSARLALLAQLKVACASGEKRRHEEHDKHAAHASVPPVENEVLLHEVQLPEVVVRRRVLANWVVVVVVGWVVVVVVGWAGWVVVVWG